MTNNEINIAIAKVCSRLVEWHDGVPYHLGEWSAVGEGNEFYAEFRPATDLNAMREAEKALGDRLALYREFLRLIVTDDPTNRYNEPAFATARQRAEAFLRTLGKWEEEEEA